MIVIMSKKLIDHLIALASMPRIYEPESYLFHQADPVFSIFIVEEGLVELTRFQSDGQPFVLHRVIGRAVLAEASAYSQNYHCDAILRSRARIFELPIDKFKKFIRMNDIHADMWAEYLARQVQSARQIAEIMSRKTVAHRLDAWLAWRGISLPPKGQWKNIASQIGVSPEALYRELSKRKRREGNSQ